MNTIVEGHRCQFVFAYSVLSVMSVQSFCGEDKGFCGKDEGFLVKMKDFFTFSSSLPKIFCLCHTVCNVYIAY